MNELDQNIIKLIAKKSYMSEIELPGKLKQNFMYVQESVKRLLSDNQIAECGTHYSDKYGKIFHYYTRNLLEPEQLRAKIANKQYLSQKRALVCKLIKSIEDNMTDGKVREELRLIESTEPKFDLQFHALNKADVIWCYKFVIQHGRRADIELTALNKEQSKKSKAKQAA